MRLVLSIAVALALNGCATSTAPGLTGTSRSQLMIMPTATINAKAALGYAQMAAEARNRGELNTNEELGKRARTVANRLVKETGAFRTDASSWAWEVNVFESEQINAFCWPGGKIGIYTGLIQRLKLSDDELAAVVGHEIAHALREHGREKASQQLLSNAVVQGIANSRSRNAAAAGNLTQLGAQFFVHLPFSRDMELEADLMGLELMARAGYDPRQASNVWKKMQAVAGGGGVEFFNTHPNSDRRIAQIEASVATVLPAYEAASGRVARVAPPISPPIVMPTLTPVPVMAAAIPAREATSTGATAPSLASSPVSSNSTKTMAIGQESYQVERMAREEGCNADARAVMTGKQPGVETYSVACSSGGMWVVRCNFGVCRVQK